MPLNKEGEDRYQYYLNESNKLTDWSTKLSFCLDKLIFGLSAGAIVISLTLVEVIVTPKNIQYINYLIFGLFCLVLTLILNLITHVGSMFHILKAKAKLNEWTKGTKVNSPDLRTKIGLITDVINLFSVVVLIVGIVFISIFGYLSIKSINMDDKTKKDITASQAKTLSSTPISNDVTRADAGKVDEKPDKQEGNKTE